MKFKKKLALFLASLMIFSCFTTLGVWAGYGVTASSQVGYSAKRVEKIDTSDMDDLRDIAYTDVTSGSSYKITDTNGLVKLYQFVNSNGLNFSGVKIYVANDITLDSSVTINPMGLKISDNKAFSGTFDGQGFTIKSYARNLSHLSYGCVTGIIGRINGATIKNVVLENVNVNSAVSASYDGRASALVGSSKGDSIVSNCYVSGTVNGARYTGALVGFVEATSGAPAHSSITVEYCTNAATVSAPGRVGGIVGFVSNDATANIQNCLNVGAVSNTGYNVAMACGGIVGGTNNVHTSGGTTISGCVNQGSVTSTVSLNSENTKVGYQTGGICGVTRSGASNKTSYFNNTTYGKVTVIDGDTAVSAQVTDKVYGGIYDSNSVPTGTDYIDNRILYTSSSAAEYHGYQTQANSDGSFDLRLVGSIDSLDYSAVGLDVTVIYDVVDSEGNVTGTYTKNVSGYCDAVYDSLIQMTDDNGTETFDAASLRSDGSDGYLFAVVLENLPAEITNMKVVATPYCTANTDGSEAVIGKGFMQSIVIPKEDIETPTN